MLAKDSRLRNQVQNPRLCFSALRASCGPNNNYNLMLTSFAHLNSLPDMYELQRPISALYQLLSVH
jgi:hypothetical protein